MTQLEAATTTSDYETFLASKRLLVPSTGIEVDPAALHPALFPFQRDLVRWSLRKGRAALFADTGLGKSVMQLEWARQIHERTGQNVLILAPLAVAQQTVTEGRKFGLSVQLCQSQADVQSGINVTNYDRLHLFSPSIFGAVVLDECFAPGTEIDTPTGRKHIETIRIGEQVVNAAGVDTVADIHRREVSCAVRITVNGQSIISSPNHPYFTQRGWVAAQDIQPGDSFVPAAEAVRMVRGDVLEANGTAATAISVLRSILLSEMADVPTGASSEGAQSHSGGEAWREEERLVSVGQFKSDGRIGSNSQTQSVTAARGTTEDLPPIESHPARTLRAWGQRVWFDQASTDFTGCTRTELESGICFVTGPTDSRLSYALQTRLSESRAANRYRGGWIFARESEAAGFEEGRQVGLARVDRFEILEPGHPDLERLRDADGKLYFYDIGATRHPSFSVNGLLVHNSSILKALDGKTRRTLTEVFAKTPYRLCCTATPAPNDIAEIANHAEFLGILTRSEMLAAFFVHDDAGWRLKGHARQPFYRWLASWGMSLKRPSDLGYSDDGYDLPPLEIRAELVSADYAPEGQLFFTGLKGIQDRTAVRRATIADRIERAARLIRSEPERQWLAWVGLNDEGRRLAQLLPEATLLEGSDAPAAKESALTRFAGGEIPILITKCSIAGFGMNFQRCNRMVFVGLGDSFEQYYQAIRRCWRFGQTESVYAYIVLTEPEEAIYQNVLRKEQQATEIAAELIREVSSFEQEEIGMGASRLAYLTKQAMRIPNWLRSVVAA